MTESRIESLERQLADLGFVHGKTIRANDQLRSRNKALIRELETLQAQYAELDEVRKRA